MRGLGSDAEGKWDVCDKRRAHRSLLLHSWSFHFGIPRLKETKDTA